MAHVVEHYETVSICSECGNDDMSCAYCLKELDNKLLCRRTKSFYFPNLNRWHFCSKRCFEGWKKRGGKPMKKYDPYDKEYK